MNYLTDRLPKDVALSALGGCAGAVIGGLATCVETTREFAKAYPHDGQNGLGGFYLGALSMPFFGLLSGVAVFAFRYRQYRKQAIREENDAFEAELLAARAVDEPGNTTA